MLTNVGLEHTRWLGPTIRRHRGREARGRARRRHVGARRRRARGGRARPSRRVRGSSGRDGRSRRTPQSAPARLPAHNFAAARRRRRGDPRPPARPGSSRRRRPVGVPGRLQVVAQRPLTIYDGAHNAPGIAALAASVPEGTVAVLSILDDKDAAEMLRALLPRLSAAVFTRAPNPRALPPSTLADLASKVGGVELRDRTRPAPRASSAHGSLQVRTERSSRQDPSTWLPNCSVHPAERRASAL